MSDSVSRGTRTMSRAEKSLFSRVVLLERKARKALEQYREARHVFVVAGESLGRATNRLMRARADLEGR
jgi:hypothetical protein